MYKVKHNISPAPLQELLKQQRKTCKKRDCACWEIPKVRTVNNGVETIRYRGPVTWNLLPNEIKESKSLTEFKTKIGKWTPQGCTCRLCKQYIPNLGFL